MRRTGKTTRLVDKAIQKLFTSGLIYVPTKTEYFSKVEPLDRVLRTKGIDESQVFVDYDISKYNDAQRHFEIMLDRRLCLEHAGSYERNRGIYTLRK